MEGIQLMELLGQGQNLWLPALLVAAAAYFLGCFNGAVIVSKYILRDDVRNHGSGNAGLTNFYRTFGGLLTFVVILTDVLKAVVALLLGVWVFQTVLVADVMVAALAKYWAGLFCLMGHMFPCMFRFKGGKGILSGGTVAIMIDWRLALMVWGGFLLLAVLTRYVSLGSCAAAAGLPLATWIIYHDPVLLALSLGISALLLYMHRANIKRLLSGTESKFTARKKAE